MQTVGEHLHALVITQTLNPVTFPEPDRDANYYPWFELGLKLQAMTHNSILSDGTEPFITTWRNGGSLVLASIADIYRGQRQSVEAAGEPKRPFISRWGGTISSRDRQGLPFERLKGSTSFPVLFDEETVPMPASLMTDNASLDALAKMAALGGINYLWMFGAEDNPTILEMSLMSQRFNGEQLLPEGDELFKILRMEWETLRETSAHDYMLALFGIDPKDFRYQLRINLGNSPLSRSVVVDTVLSALHIEYADIAVLLKDCGQTIEQRVERKLEEHAV